jgi:hypothetical protein
MTDTPLTRITADERPSETPIYFDVMADETSPVLTHGSDVAAALPVLATSATPTQVANPARTTWRSVFQLGVALFTAIPVAVPIITGTWDGALLGAVAVQVLAVNTAAVRIMAIKPVNDWLVQHAPALAAIPTRTAEL